ncbi:MAG TPA: GAF domain-containing protein [Candidatus Acidoferrales bacterium]|jgi:GAF domain-containing protein|nr:GAF domain-containing protein [Candidatus Acidoferrales bacterium]
MKPPVPANEAARLEALRQYDILDTAPEQAFDDITRIAAFICVTPTAIMALIDRERQWFKSKVGEKKSETPREQAFCAYTILEPQLLEVEDAREDERFADNPLVTSSPNIRFYAGAPLLTPEGLALGSLCVIDQQPRKLNAGQKESLGSLARLVMMTIELRQVSRKLADAAANLKTLSGMLPICGGCKKIRNDGGYWKQVEAYIQEHTDATFSHGLCPECTEKYFPGIKPPSKG